MSNICFIVRSSVFLMECQLFEQFFTMNTDACNVEDINIPHITECLSLSFVASFEDWYCLFRTWSFTLCENNLNPNDNSDSAGVHIIVFNNESVRVLCEYNRSNCSIFHQFIRFPLLRRPSFIIIPFWVAWWASVFNQSPCSLMLLSPRAQRSLTFVSGFHRAFWCSGS